MTDPSAVAPQPVLPSPSRQRAGVLLKAGIIGGHAGALVSSAYFFAAVGVAAGLSCLLAAAVALAFYIVGQAVQVHIADDEPQRILVASLVSYGVRVSTLGGLLALAMTQGERLRDMDPTAVVVGTLSVVITWLAGEIIAFSRMRIPVYEAQVPKPGTPTAGGR